MLILLPIVKEKLHKRLLAVLRNRLHQYVCMTKMEEYCFQNMVSYMDLQVQQFQLVMEKPFMFMMQMVQLNIQNLWGKNVK